MHDKRKEEKYGNDAEKARANTNCEALHGLGALGLMATAVAFLSAAVPAAEANGCGYSYGGSTATDYAWTTEDTCLNVGVRIYHDPPFGSNKWTSWSWNTHYVGMTQAELLYSSHDGF